MHVKYEFETPRALPSMHDNDGYPPMLAALNGRSPSRVYLIYLTLVLTQEIGWLSHH